MTVNILKLIMRMTFIQLAYQCGSNLCYYISNIIYLVFINMLTTSLHIDLFTLYVLNTCHLCKIMAESSICDPFYSDFVSDTLECNICQKLMHYSCAKVNLLANFMFDIAHCSYSDYCLDTLTVMNINDDQIVPMNAISNSPTNFYFYHLMLGIHIHIYIVNIIHG